MTAPAAFHVMAKPTGARCNLHCDYCFYMEKGRLYPGSDFRMPDAVMGAYVRQAIEASRAQRVTIAWQGGEPTLMGLGFFRRAVAMEKKYARPGMTIENTLQTNGLLLDAQWCRFLRENKFLVGLSLDGPRHLHDAYRHDHSGRSVFDRVVRAAKLMQRHRVDFNILCTVNGANSRYPSEVYLFFRDELKTPFLQFIPIVEIDPAGGRVTDRSVRPEQYGRFLIEIFDEWVRRDVGSTFVLFFDGVLASYLNGRSSLCVLRPTCGDALALEHNGDVYSCDHFVTREHLLGNIMGTPLEVLAASEKQRCFGRAKTDMLPGYCRKCRYLFACYGECPKNRLALTPDGEPGLSWLCPGLKTFFRHTERPMRIMAELLRRGRPAGDIMKILPAADITCPADVTCSSDITHPGS